MAKEHRGRQPGRKIVKKTLEEIKSWENIALIEIEAKEYLKDFYSSFCFRQTSKPFDDGGVMHVAMELDVS